MQISSYRLGLISGIALLVLSWTSASRASAEDPTGAISSQAQPWKVVQPRDGATVRAADFFIAVRVREGYELDRNSVSLYLDGRDISEFVKGSGSVISVLLGTELSNGEHSLELTARGSNGHFWQPLEWSFSIEGTTTNTDRSVRATSVSQSSKFDLLGSAEIATRNATLSGNNQLKLEPLSTQTFFADVAGQYRSIRFPLKVQLTSNESAFSQPRNRLLFGVESHLGKFLIGDTTPELNELIASGTRSRGALAEINAGPLHLLFARGALQRGINGITNSQSTVNSLSALEGTYTRDMTALRIGVGSSKSVLFSISGIRATDDSLSAASELRPLQNLVVGADIAVKALKNRVQVQAGSAMSVTTEDISRGASTKSEIDSLFQTNLPVDPASFSPLIILNPTTYPLRIDELTSLSWFTKGTFRLPNNTIRAEARSIGSAFYSAANPYQQPNRSSIFLSDRFHVLQQKVTGSTSYSRYISSPETIDDSYRLASSTFATSFSVRPSPSSARYTAGLRLNNRTRSGFGPGDPATSTHMRTYSGGFSHAFDKFGSRHLISLSASRTNRTDAASPQFSSASNSITAVVTEQLPSPLYVTAQLTLLQLKYNSLTTSQNWTTSALLVGYRFGIGLNASGRYAITHTNDSDLAPASNRHAFTLQATYDIGAKMQLEMQVGFDRYAQRDNSAIGYTEQFVVLRHRYTF